MFHYKGNNYLVLADYYSGYYEVQMMTKTTASALINSRSGLRRTEYLNNSTPMTQRICVVLKVVESYIDDMESKVPKIQWIDGAVRQYCQTIKKCDRSGEELELLMAINTPRDQDLGTKLIGRNTRTPLSVLTEHPKPCVPAYQKHSRKDV